MLLSRSLARVEVKQGGYHITWHLVVIKPSPRDGCQGTVKERKSLLSPWPLLTENASSVYPYTQGKGMGCVVSNHPPCLAFYRSLVKIAYMLLYFPMPSPLLVPFMGLVPPSFWGVVSVPCHLKRPHCVKKKKKDHSFLLINDLFTIFHALS